MLADEMGLGKTIQIVALIAYLMEVASLLACVSLQSSGVGLLT